MHEPRASCVNVKIYLLDLYRGETAKQFLTRCRCLFSSPEAIMRRISHSHHRTADHNCAFGG